jgi:LysR family transcriptional regulator, cys regulon transcriptional activator
MKLRTLECFCEIASNGFNFSRAAKVLHATQPAITRQIQLLEHELGFPVFERHGNRAVRLTAAGQDAFERAQKIIRETRELHLIKEDSRDDVSGQLIVATTEFNARYTLLPAIKKFRADHPRVALSILSVDPRTAAQLVISGNAHFGLCSATMEAANELLTYKCFEVDRLVIVPRGHPLTRVKKLTLEQIAAYPLIVYDPRLSGGRRVLEVFEEHGIKVQIALSAMSADVIKSYVAAGVGIGIIQESAFERRKDEGIQALNSRKLFGPTSIFLLLRKGSLPRTLSRKFISLLAPELDLFESKESSGRSAR